MQTRDTAVSRVENAVAEVLQPGGRCVLAVSGGRDSMVLLDAAARSALSASQIVVATFDHGTGPVATSAVELVAREAAARGVECVAGRARRVVHREAEWREARWEFLRAVAEREKARIATAHTRDDQVETVVIRILRDAGARGLAGLYAPSDVLRPLLDESRAGVGEYAAARAVRYVADPSNLSRRHLRNRLRLDILPAIQAIRPDFAAEVLAVARQAACWRARMAAIVDTLKMERLDARTLRIAVECLQGYDAASLRVLWPEVAARVGVTMDRRGTQRAAAFTIDVLASNDGRMHANRFASGAGGRGRVIQLSGGADIRYVRGAFILRRS